MHFSILLVTVFFFVNEAFMVKPQGISGGTGNSWIYFGRGLNQKEIIDIAASKPNPEDKAETTLSPVETTVPAETTAVPVEATTVPIEITTVPVEITTAPIETTVAPVESTAAPVESTAAPVETTAAPAETTAASVETTAEVKVESTAVPEAPTTAELIANVKTELSTAAPEILPLEKIISTALPETNENIRGLPENVAETTESPKSETTPEAVSTSTLASVEIVTSEAPKTEIKEVETTPSPPEGSWKIKIVVIPKEYTSEPPAPTDAPAPEEESAKPELPASTEAPTENSKPEESSSSSEENHYLKPDLHSMLRRIYKGNGPLHH